MEQRQDSVTDQIGDLYKLAVKNGMRDAADWLTRAWNKQVFGPANLANKSPVAEVKESLENVRMD